MKVFGKWLVKGTVNGKSRVASSFMSKKEAIEALDLHFKKISDTEWQDTLEQIFTIEKNTKEYK